MKVGYFDFSAPCIWAVLLRHRDVFMRNVWSSMVPPFFEPLTYLFAMGFGLGSMVAQVEGLSYAQFIAPSLVAMVGLIAPGVECLVGTLARLVVQRTFEGMIATRVSVEDVIAGEALYGAAKGALHAAAVGITVAAFGLLPSPWSPLILVVVFFGGLMIASMTLIFTSFMPNFSPIDFWFSMVLSPLLMFSDTFFPVSQLPAWAQKLANLSPFYHMVRPARMFATGRIDWSLVAIDGAWIAGYFLIFFTVAVWLFKRRLVK